MLSQNWQDYFYKTSKLWEIHDFIFTNISIIYEICEIFVLQNFVTQIYKPNTYMSNKPHIAM